MSFITIVLIALALAMDAFAVSITSGATIRKMRLHHAVRIAAFFGAFQAVMPILGWTIGRFAEKFITSYDHWVAFGLLAFVGGKMVWEALHRSCDNETCTDPLNVYILLTLAVATSIDAAAVGISLSFLKIRIVQPAMIIGVVTFLTSLGGVAIGRRFGDLFGRKIEIIGGLVLIGIGIKIAVQHQFFS